MTFFSHAHIFFVLMLCGLVYIQNKWYRNVPRAFVVKNKTGRSTVAKAVAASDGQGCGRNRMEGN